MLFSLPHLYKMMLYGGGILDIQCTTCAYYTYDEDYEEYLCDCQIDEDDYYRIMQGDYKSCPYYCNGDEYAVVRKQI